MAEERSRLLVETAWLAEHLHDPHLRLVDMRGYVRAIERDGVQDALYVGAREEYERAHLPGAVYIDWSSDLTDPDDPVEAQVAPPARFAALMEHRGIGDEHLVIAYDAHPTAQFATRLWWALNYYGHGRVAVLNGGFTKWQRESLPLTDSLPSYPPTTFTPRVQPQWRATAEEVLTLLKQPAVKLIDARDSGQYTGAVVRGHSRPGHIPGAINIPREAVIDPTTGTFRRNDELAHIFTPLQALPEQRVLAYCNGGVAATTLLFSLALLGYTHLSNYDGSWNEWGKRQDLPTEM